MISSRDTTDRRNVERQLGTYKIFSCVERNNANIELISSTVGGGDRSSIGRLLVNCCVVGVGVAGVDRLRLHAIGWLLPAEQVNSFIIKMVSLVTGSGPLWINHFPANGWTFASFLTFSKHEIYLFFWFIGLLFIHLLNNFGLTHENESGEAIKFQVRLSPFNQSWWYLSALKYWIVFIFIESAFDCNG